MAWFDRDGKQTGTAGTATRPNTFRLSPDGKQVAVELADTAGQNRDLWLLDLSRGIRSRFTFHAANDWLPVWSPDASRIVFASARDGPYNLYQKLASGAASEEALLQSNLQKSPHDWSRDGRFLVYSTVDPKTRQDLWILPMTGDRKPTPYLHTEFDESHAQFSPDGRWMAYSSNESGRYEVYAQAFPAAGGRWQISSEGGSQARWRGDGKELFYTAPDRRLMSVQIKTTPKFEASVPKPLFQTRIINPTAQNAHYYSVTADGKRFLINVRSEETSSSPITVVENWLVGVKR